MQRYSPEPIQTKPNWIHNSTSLQLKRSAYFATLNTTSLRKLNVKGEEKKCFILNREALSKFGTHANIER